KRDYFPIAKGKYAEVPDEEKNESALFFHPLDDDPEPSFIFDEETGIVGGDDRAQACIKFFDLNRDELPGRRKNAFATAAALISEIADFWEKGVTEANRLKKDQDILEAAKRGLSEFSFV